jgi:hypothetical protein
MQGHIHHRDACLRCRLLSLEIHEGLCYHYTQSRFICRSLRSPRVNAPTGSPRDSVFTLRPHIDFGAPSRFLPFFPALLFPRDGFTVVLLVLLPLPRLSGTLLFDPIFASLPDVCRSAYQVRGYIYLVWCSFLFNFLYQTHGCYTHFLAIGLDLGGNKNSARRDGKKEDAIPPARVYGFLFSFPGHCFFGSVGFLVTLCDCISSITSISDKDGGATATQPPRHLYAISGE